ncbi:MAG: hypothetical protein WBB24_11020, partial [Maribacter sp.]
MKLRIVTLLLIWSITNCAFGQSYNLQGEVRDQYSTPIPFASVFLLTVTDSSLVKGTSADELGGFSIQEIPEG